jgi:hypothetical protein
MGSVVVFFHLLWSHRRKMLLIKTERYQRPAFDLPSFSLFTGLLLGGVGLSLTIFLQLMVGRGIWLLGGIIPLSIGCALLLYFVIKRHVKD